VLRETNETAGRAEVEFERLIADHYRPLYQFAMSLTGSEADAWDLTQQTFYVWAVKGDQLRDCSKVKTWMFTTMHRAFLEKVRRQTRFPHSELSEAEWELPLVAPELGSNLDKAKVRDALSQVDKLYQTPVRLFYLDDFPYKEIARILSVPLGTVKSRIARGLDQLRKLLLGDQFLNADPNGAT